MKENYLFITTHDFRTSRWASTHFIADLLAKRAKVRFFSIRFSLLSRTLPDPRNAMAADANQIETVRGIDCYLWRTLIHPVNLRLRLLEPLEAWLYKFYVALTPRFAKDWMREATTVIIESGTGPVFVPLLKRLNPGAKIIYLGSDTMEMLRCDRYIRETLYAASESFEACIVCSRHMTNDFAPGAKVYFVPHGIEKSLDSLETRSPYGPGTHAVSVGSSLFDPRFFEIAGRLCPDVTFHVIGCGIKRPAAWAENVLWYDEMKFIDTVPYIKHASIGIAPYEEALAPASMADSSMKLMQYSFFGLPAVCPETVLGGYPRRFGYRVDDAGSVVRAIEGARSAGVNLSAKRPLTWEQVTERVVDPAAYLDTDLAASPRRQMENVRDAS